MVNCSQQRAGAEGLKVRVALQLEDGTRLQDEFQCGKTLWDVLTHFPQTRVCLEEIPPGQVTVCIYMRDEMSGEHILKKTTLLSLGLTGGSAIIRFVVRKCDASASRVSSGIKEETQREKDSEDKVSESSSITDVLSSEPVCQDETLSFELAKRQPPTVPTTSVEKVVPSMGESQLHADSVQPKISLTDLSKPQPPSQASSFVPFLGGGHRLGGGSAASIDTDQKCATAQEPLYSPEHSKPKKSRTDQDDNEPVKREPIVCHMDLEQNVRASTQEVPDDFFEVTVDDVRRRFAELKNERHRLEEAPLMTKALRETQLKEKLERYPKVVLRVLFPDRYIVQGFFRVTETLGAVVEFVRSHLEEPQTPFYLFITPPRTELRDESQTLFQAQLFPAAVIHFGSPKHREHYLQQRLLREPASPSQADMVVARAIPRLPSSSPVPVMENLPSTSTEEPRRAPENYEEESDISESHQHVQRDVSKVPKWLKLPGKK